MNKLKKENKYTKRILPLALAGVIAFPIAQLKAEDVLRTRVLVKPDISQITLGFKSDQKEGGETLRANIKKRDKGETINIGSRFSFSLGDVETNTAIYASTGETEGLGLELESKLRNNTTVLTLAKFNDSTYTGITFLRDINDTISLGGGINAKLGDENKLKSYVKLDLRLSPKDTLSTSFGIVSENGESGNEYKLSYLHLRDDLGFRLLANHQNVPAILPGNVGFCVSIAPI
jgi:hypothetical protein